MPRLRTRERPRPTSRFPSSGIRGLHRLAKAGVGMAAIFGLVFAFAAELEVAHGKRGVVATRSPLASEVGAEILGRGGNAIDAAVAAGFALAVTYPSAGNLGGGGFMVIRLADGRVVANDHRETAPFAAGRDMYLDENGEVVEGLSTASHLAVGVPGTVAGLLEVLARHGTLSRQEVIAPALRLAEQGFALPEDIASQLQRQRQAFAPYPASAAKFAKPDGSAYAAGDPFLQPDLAGTLRRISETGRDGFYAGRTADLIVAEMKRGDGLVSKRDLADYRPIWRQPVRGTYRGYEILSMPPPSSGGLLVVQMLNMLEAYDLASLGFGSPATVHLMVEAERRAYADRAEHLGDPDYHEVPAAMLVDKKYARERFADFDPRKASLSEAIGAGRAWPEEGTETTHVSVMDAAGNAVAYTTTLNLSYGSKIVVPGAGFLLNNEMDDFSSKPGVANAFGLLGGDANAIEPGKRMLSSMTPTIVMREGEPYLVTGSPGGSTIITTVLQVLVNVLDHGMDLAAAVAAPRFHHQWMPNAVIYEADRLTPKAVKRLGKFGHVELREVPFRVGDANSTMRLGDALIGVADPRNSGSAVGR